MGVKPPKGPYKAISLVGPSLGGKIFLGPRPLKKTPQEPFNNIGGLGGPREF